MTVRYVKTQWEKPDQQTGTRNLGTGLFSPVLDDINNLSLTVSRTEYMQILSVIEFGSEIIYTEESHKLVSIWLSALQANDYLGDGTYYPPYSAFVEWLPVSPYRTDLDQKPFPQMVFPAWNVYSFDLPQILDDFLGWFGTSLETITGYQVGDAYSLVFNMNHSDIASDIKTWLFNGDSDNMLETGFNLHVRGSGVMQVELLSVPLGGRMMYSVDKPVSTFDVLQGFFDPDDDIIDTDRDLISIPPEQDAESLEEIIIDDDGDHIIYFRLVPMLNDSVIPIAWGGGLRSIRLGEGLIALDAETGEPLNDDNPNNQNLGIIMTTETDMYNALVRIRDEETRRWALASDPNNVVSGAEISPDSSDISIKTNTISTAPVVSATNLERANGGAYFQALKFAKLFDDMNSRKGDGFTVETVQSLVSLFLNPLETVALDVLVNTYFLANPTQTINVSVLAESIYCEGDIYSGVKEYALTLADETKLNRLVDFVREIPIQTASKWFDEGSSIPRSDYLSYACTLRETLNFTIDTVTTSQTNTPVTGWSFSSPRLVRVTVSGRIIRTSTGEIIDGKNRLNSSGLIQGSAWSVLTINAGTTSLYAPAEFSPDENGDGAYSVSVVNGNSTFAFKHAVDWTGDFTGSITVKIEDLGAE